ncbi:pentapeptide repeat-containing protein [Nocardia mexicana]|nr:pentapeptide repeat-containing protein [Nocardia mexicana]
MALSTAVGLAVLGGVALAAAAEIVLILVFHPSRAGGSPIDVTKLALTVVGGVGGVVALVIAYRRQRDLEQGRFVERFSAAAAQLGAPDVAVRIAGVYAMVGVADESVSLRRQQCIDVLCGYLRLPYTPEVGANHQTKYVQTRKNADGVEENESTFEYRQNDKEVRQTIVRVIADHLHPDSQYSWSSSNFDFRTVNFEEARFSKAIFSGDSHFEGATFVGEAWFDHASFSHDATFMGATFLGNAHFDDVTFHESAWFTDANFCGNHTQFGGATFGYLAWFDHTTFCDSLALREATFSNMAWFEGAEFSNSWLNDTTFFGDAVFRGATFSGRTSFEKTTFSHSAVFDEAAFSGTTLFASSIFQGDTSFGGVTFSGATLFKHANFGESCVSFVAPQQWGPPAPVFDWDTDISLKPPNIKPSQWPPRAETSRLTS